VILSASSEFFKTLLKKNKHPNPLIYLRGLNSNLLGTILDFIYHGQVTVMQEELNKFLTVAHDLGLKGLATKNEMEKTVELQETIDNTAEDLIDESEFSNESRHEVQDDCMEESMKDKPSEQKGAVVENEQLIKNMIEHKGDKLQCKYCGQLSKNEVNMTKHVRSHMTGFNK
jgi:hypothetical protein